MAKAVFHKSQRVFVKQIGTWAHVEQVIPQWAQGVDEPIRVHYDVGMGRNFSADELESEGSNDARSVSLDGDWRIVRAQNKWRTAEDCQDHPFPGTHPLVLTSDMEWGGWRVPGAEYNRDPRVIEQQAMLIAKSPTLAGILVELVKQADDLAEDLPHGLLVLAQRANEELREIGIHATDEPVDIPEVTPQVPDAPAHISAPMAPPEPANERLQAAARAVSEDGHLTKSFDPALALDPDPAMHPAPRAENVQHFGQRVQLAAGANYERA